MSPVTALDDAEILSGMLGAGTPDFNPEAARAILRLGFSEEQETRMVELADRGNRGELSADEQDLLHRFRRVGNFLALIQSKARLSLQRARQ